jgi:hypothetical protein
MMVSMLAAAGHTKHDIADLILNPDSGKPISVTTLDKHFGDDYASGPVKVNAKIGSRLAQKAMAGDNTCMIFWLKTRAGWRENAKLELTGPGGGPIRTQATPADLSALSAAELAQLEELLSKAQPTGA